MTPVPNADMNLVRLPDGVGLDVAASLGVPAMTAHRALTVHAHGYDVSRQLRNDATRHSYLRYLDADGIITMSEFSRQKHRAIMAELGFRTIEEMVGRVDCLDTNAAIQHWKADGLDLTDPPRRPPRPALARARPDGRARCRPARRCAAHRGCWACPRNRGAPARWRSR